MTREIPKKQWTSYLRNLSLKERQRPVRIDVEGVELGDQRLGRHLPLLDIELAAKGSAHGEIELLLAGEEGPFSHRIASPARIYAEEDEAGALVCLDIEDRAGVKTLIRFEHAKELTAEFPAGM